MATEGRGIHVTEHTRVEAIGLLYEVARSIENVLAPQLAAHGLPWLDGGVMIRLSRAPDHRLRMSDLAIQAALSNSGLTRIVDRLEVAGLVRRESSATDRRVTYVALTKRGTERIVAVMPGQLERVEQIFIDVTEAEADAFLTTLAKIRDAARAADAVRPDLVVAP